MIRFGPMSIALLVLGLQALLLAAALARAPANRRANRYLAALLVVIAGMLTPFVIGYAGFYDAYRWLNFAPFAMPLAVGPLVYAHVRALTADVPLRWPHWVLPGAQFVYQSVCFALPLEAKNAFEERVQGPVVEPITDLLVLASLAAYGWASSTEARRYREWLGARRRSVRPAARVQRALLAVMVLLVGRAGYDSYDRLVAAIDYFDLFGFYLLLGALAVYLGIEGWRQAHDPAPAAEPGADRDWRAQGAAWLATMRQAGWADDPELDLAGLARRLGTNTTNLSRALNDGHGGFAEAIGRVRAEAVAARIDAGDTADLLTLAMDAGFGSKASFNRAFKAHFGMTPSAYRAARDGSDSTSSRLQADLRRVAG
jgi:AraC-like DNA-binding protein/uncharacterized membrane protein YhdT